MSALLIEETEQLNTVPMNTVPMNTVPMNTVPMNTVPMNTVPMGRVGAPRPLAKRPAAARTPSGPSAARPVVSVRHLADVRPVACQVAVDEPMWELTRRGLVVVMALLATVMGSVAVTCVVAFLSVSNSPL